MNPIEDLQAELQTLLIGLPEFVSSGFSVYDLDDMEQQVEHANAYPASGVMYEGARPIGNAATPEAKASNAAGLIELQFSIIIALQYGFSGQGGDAKKPAFKLLDSVRKTVLGYRGVNSRPWRFAGEQPELAASGDGVVYYSQIWRTSVPVTGNFSNS